jgi:chorismate synthase
MSNSFGERFRITTFGESHGTAMGVVIDGVRPGLDFDIRAIQRDVDRRRPGQNALVSSRQERDRVQILSGVFEGKTLGTPICLIIPNEDADSDAYADLKDLFCPGQAGYTTLKKYGIRDYRGGGRLSGRETVSRVAAGALARKELEKEGIRIIAYTREVGGIEVRKIDVDEIENNPLRCPDKTAARRMEKKILSCKREGDSIGGVVEVVARNVPAGLGEPVFKKLDGEIAQALMSIGGVKAVEIGDGIKVSISRGSENNDPMGPEGFKSNHAGGILGGISTGQDIVARIAVKPTPSIAREQRTVDVWGNPKRLSIHGRHDPCICPRIAPVAETMMSLVLYNALLVQQDLISSEKGLEEMRQEIDALDRRFLDLLAERMEVSSRIGKYKKERGMKVRDPKREEELLEQRTEQAVRRGLDKSTVRQIFTKVLACSRKSQRCSRRDE